MKSIILALSLLFAFSSVEAGNVTTDTPIVPEMVNTTADLINLNIIQMNREVDAAQANIDLLNTRYEEKLGLVDQNHNFVVEEINHLNEKLDILVMESSYKKICVEKYRNGITNPKTVVTTVTSCVTTARGKSPTLTNTAKTYLTNAISRRTNFITYANNCLKNQHGVYNQTTCINAEIERWRNAFNSDLLSLNNELESQLCLSNSYIKIAQQCVSTYISKVFGTMNNSYYKIQSCIEGKDNSVPCVVHRGMIYSAN